MKNIFRIFLVCLVLFGGVAIFAYWSTQRFNQSLDTLRDTCYTIANQSPVLYCNETNNASGSAADVGDPTDDSLALSTDSSTSFIFPKIDSELYIGCTYLISSQSLAPSSALSASLLDVGTNAPVDPVLSGLTSDQVIESDAQGFTWRVGAVAPGTYSLSLTDPAGLDIRSDAFVIKAMPSTATVEEQAALCLSNE